MRILFTVDPEIPVPPGLYGGIERIVDLLITELRKRGHQVGLTANSNSTCSTDYFAGWPAKQSNGFANTVRNTATLLGVVRKFAPDVIHSFSRLGYLLPLLQTRIAKIMSYQRHTGGPRNAIAAKLGGRHFNFTACSEYIADQGRKWGGRWFVIPNFVDTDFYWPSLSVEPDAPLLFLSRVERIKGTHNAIKIAQQAGRKLIIAGNRVEQGEGPAYWADEIAPHIDGHNIEYVGPVNDAQKRDLLRRAAALVVPVEWGEPFGIVFVEALASGTPVISCPRGALPEIVEDGRNGFLIDSVSDGVKAVEKLSVISRQHCRERAEQKFSADVVASQYESLYGQMIGDN